MQLIEEKRVVDRSKKHGHITPMLTSLGRTGQPGKIAVIKSMPVKFGKKQPVENPSDFSSWNMPVQETGVIKCRDHEFW